MRYLSYSVLLLCTLLLTACTTTVQSSLDHQDLDRQATWAILPIANNTDTPQAGLSAESMVEHLVRRRGIANLSMYPSALSRDSLFEPTERKVSEEALKWARSQGIRYAITGSVEEWRYKVGIDGEPAVGLTLKVIDVSKDMVVWSGSGAKSGWSRQALSAVAQSLITELLTNMKLASAK